MFMPNDRDLLYLLIACGCATLGATTDIKSRRIPNLLTVSAFAFGLVLHTVLDGGHGALLALLGGLACGSIFLIFYLAGGMGAGDVKLITAVGCIAGLPHVAYLLVLTSLAGGLMAVILAMKRGRLRETFVNVGALAAHHVHRGLTPHEDLNAQNPVTLRLPYGIAIAMGAILTLYLFSTATVTP